MGTQMMDQYTYLHLASGIIVYFFGIDIISWLVIHTIFEYLENTKLGMRLINSFHYWPGGKTYADSFQNIFGDTVGSMLGWVSAYTLDQLGKKHKWHEL